MICQYRVVQSAFFAALMLAAAGCGPSQATVLGTVTLQGKPVTSGMVLFVGPNNQIATGKLDEDGHYAARRVPMGNFKVAVQTFRPEQVKVPVPPKYADPETSGLTCDVNQPQQRYNIDMK